VGGERLRDRDGVCMSMLGDSCVCVVCAVCGCCGSDQSVQGERSVMCSRRAAAGLRHTMCLQPDCCQQMLEQIRDVAAHLHLPGKHPKRWLQVREEDASLCNLCVNKGNTVRGD